MRKTSPLILALALLTGGSCQSLGDRSCNEAAMLEFGIVGDLEGVWTDADGDGLEFGPRFVFDENSRPSEFRLIRIEMDSPIPAWEGGFDTYGCSPGDIPLEVGGSTRLVLALGYDGGSVKFHLFDALVEPGHFWLEYATSASQPSEVLDVLVAGDGNSITVHRFKTANPDGGETDTFFRAP